MIIHLPFDTNLFNYPVGKVILESNWDEKTFLELSEGFKLVYIFSEIELEIQSSDIQLQDIKVTFKKNLNEAPNQEDVHKYAGPFSYELLELAYESGIYSRFRRDSRLSNGEFRKLYKTWISEAIKHKHVYITPYLEGMLTLSFENEVGNIGLLAVSKEHQGKGWGRKLLNAAIFFTNEKGIKALKVATQELNRQALGLYSSLGFQEVDRVYIYHYWNPNFS